MRSRPLSDPASAQCLREERAVSMVVSARPLTEDAPTLEAGVGPTAYVAPMALRLAPASLDASAAQKAPRREEDARPI